MNLAALLFLILIGWIEARQMYDHAISSGFGARGAAAAGLIWGALVVVAALKLADKL